MSGPSPWSHQAGWSCAAQHVADARHFVHQTLERHGLATVASEASLVVSELATNAVLHAATPFTVTLALREGRVTIAVRDSSRRQLPAIWADVDAPARPHGRGLHIVQTLSRSCGVVTDRQGKSVWASFDTGDPAVAPPPSVFE